jgi:hypothetical protein
MTAAEFVRRSEILSFRDQAKRGAQFRQNLWLWIPDSRFAASGMTV